MAFHFFSNELTNDQVEQEKDNLIENQVKVEANARFCFVGSVFFGTLYFLISGFVGMRNNYGLQEWFIALTSSRFLFFILGMLTLCVYFLRLNLLLNFKLFCLENFSDYTTQTDSIKKEYKAFGYTQLGTLLLIISLAMYALSTFLPADVGNITRGVCAVAFIVSFFVYARSAVIRSGFEKM